MRTDQHDEAATLTTAQCRLLDRWRVVSSDLRKLAQSLGHLSGTCASGVSGEPGRERLDCAVLLQTVAWRIDELLDESGRFLSGEVDLLTEFGTVESTARMDALRGRIEALARTFAQIETFAQRFSQGCSAAQLPVIRRLADDLLVRCSALDEVLGFPRPSRRKV